MHMTLGYGVYLSILFDRKDSQNNNKCMIYYDSLSVNHYKQN